MVRSKFLRGLIIFFCLSNNSFSQTVADKPPMGWNSYNSFGSSVHEDEVKANTDYMVKYLKPIGWQYIIVDFCWSYPNPPNSIVGNPFQFKLSDGSLVPYLNMDEYGRLLPDDHKFPSAINGSGFKALADYVHSQGLKFGIHIMRGIPRQAVRAKTKVLGTDGITADMIADTNSICPWLNHMYGVDMKKQGAQEYLNSLANLYASWGVDYIKMDDASLRNYYQAEVEGMHKAILQCGRPIVLSLSPGQQFKYHENMVENANAYRISGDFWDNWSQLLRQFDHCKQWEEVSGPGHWPDADMIQIGKISKRGPEGLERFSRFTEDEQRTHVTLWSIFRSPLMMGGNMVENTDYVKSLLTNDEVIDVNQNSVGSHELGRKDSTIIWVSQPIGNSKAWNVAFFNLNPTAHDVSINFADLSIKQKVNVRDLWNKKDLGSFKKTYVQSIPSHGAAIFRFTTL